MTKLEIFNAALAALANDRFLSSADSTFPEGVHCRREWDAARKSVLSAAEWGWLVEQTPYCDSYDPGTGNTLIPRPADALRILALVDENGRSLKATSANGAFRISGQRMVAIRYLPDNDEPDTWPHYITDAVAKALASRIAIPFKHDADLAQAVTIMAQRSLLEAVAIDSAESRHSGTAGDKYARARR